MNSNIKTLFTVILTIPVFLACNKKCGSIESSVSGKDVALYDFKDCFIYAHIDSTLAITTDTAFQSYKNKYFKFCTSGNLQVIDFSQKMLLGQYVTTSACNTAFHRSVEVDDNAKTVTYRVTTESCGKCGTPISSPNFVTAPQLPSGYKLIFVHDEK